MIYLDNASTTPLDSGVLEKMMPYLTASFANPDSQHGAGREAALAVLNARDTLSKIIGCKSENLYFVSGGTEAGNWAVKGACAAQSDAGRHLVVSAIEHPALIESALDLRKFGYEVTFVNPDADGVIQPVEEIGAICKKAGVFYYCDCVQTAGVLPFPVGHCDALGLSAHKFYGPKGVGAIYISPTAKINRLISGGKQERGLRAGTTFVAGAVGCAAALECAVKSAAENNAAVSALRSSFEDNVLREIDGVHVNGAGARLPAHSNLSFDGCDGENILFLLDMKGIAVSTGSACSAGAVKQSHVLKAMGLSDSRIRSAVRFTFGKYNTFEEVDEVVAELKSAVAKIRRC